MYKHNKNRTAKQVKKEVLKRLGEYYPNLKLSVSKVKRLLRRYVGLSYKRTIQVNSAKISQFSMDLRERWIRLFLKLTIPYKCNNVLSIDETAWYYNMGSRWGWGIRG